MSKITYRAAAYIRLSFTDDKSNESDSVQNQRNMLANFIEANADIELVSEFVDDGVSGIAFDRPAFKEMMAAVQDGEIDCIIVKDLSRFGREYIETGRYLRRILPSYGVRFIAINDNIDTLEDRGDDLVVGVKAIMNDAYCRDISVKTRSSLKAKRENGEYVGAVPIYGYMRVEGNKNQLVIDEYPASVVRDIYRMKRDGMSASKIADTLNSLGVLSPLRYKAAQARRNGDNTYKNTSDNTWTPKTVLRILAEENYTGTLVQARQSTFNYKIKDIVHKPRTEWVRTENAHEAIIQPAEFDLVQRIMRLDTRSSPAYGGVHLFSGVLICGCCGSRMVRKTNRYKGTEYLYYYCRTTKKDGCNLPMMREDELANCVLTSIKSHVANIASLDEVISKSSSQRVINALVNQIRTQIADNDEQRDTLNGYKATLYGNLVKGIITKDEHAALKTKFENDIQTLISANETLNAELAETLEGKSERLKWIEHFKHFETLTELDRRTVLNLVESITIKGKNSIKISFRYRSEFENALAALLGVPARAQRSGARGERRNDEVSEDLRQGANPSLSEVHSDEVA